MNSYDVVIVGASFAGLTLAHNLPKSFKILIVDVKPEAGFNVESTGLITEHSRQEFLEFFPVDDYITNEITSLCVVAPDFEDHFISSVEKPWIYQTDTKGLIRALAEKLPKNVTLQTRTAFQGAKRIMKTDKTSEEKENKNLSPEQNGLEITLSSLDRCQGGIEKVFTRFLVGADGRRSKVATCFSELSRNKTFLFGYEQVFFGDIHLGNMPEKTIYHFWLGEALSGYGGWLSPTIIQGKRAFRVGLAQHLKNQQHIHAIFQRFLEDLIKRHIITLENNPSERDSKIPKPYYHFGCPIPIGGALKNIHTENVLLIGDAAGFCGAFAADGIKGSVISGKEAAKVIYRYLHGKKEALNEFKSLMNKHNFLMDYYKRQVRYRFLWNMMKKNRTFRSMYNIIKAEQDTFLQQYCDSKDKHKSLTRTVLKFKHFPKLMKFGINVVRDQVGV